MEGRTDLPFDQILEEKIKEWKKCRRALRNEDQMKGMLSWGRVELIGKLRFG